MKENVFLTHRWAAGLAGDRAAEQKMIICADLNVRIIEPRVKPIIKAFHLYIAK